MPEAADIAEVQTTLQADIAAKTKAAVQDTGFDAAFDREVEAAIAKDDRSKEASSPATPAPEVKEPEKPKAAKRELPVVADIPEALLGKKEAKTSAEPKADATVDPEREKFLKEQTAGLSTKAADRFRAIEAKAHAAEQKAVRADKLEKELNEARERLKGAVDSTQQDELKKQLEELDGIVQKQAIADHPRFRAKYDAQISKEIEIAKKFAPKETQDEVSALLSLPETAQRNRRLNEIVAELDPLESRKFFSAVDNADRLSSERSDELANWKANKVKLQELTQAEQEQAVNHRKTSIEKALKTVLPKFTGDDGVELFRKDDGNDEWNAKVEARLDNVRKLTEADLSREEIAEMAAWAIGSTEYRRLFFTQRALVQRLQEEIASLKSGEPGLGDGGLGGGGDDDEKGGMIDVVARVAQKQGVVR